jgi:hypothetical protein
MSLTEDSVVAKVAELMDTLDHIKKYDAIAHSLKKFVLIVGGSIGLFLVIQTLFELFEIELTLDATVYFAVIFLSLLIPLTGLLIGGVFMKKKVNSVKQGEWKGELSKGFSSALKILTELDWDKTLDDISIGRFGYAVYGLLKTAAYLVVSVSAFELIWNGLTFLFFHKFIVAGALFWGLFAILLVFVVLGNDLLKRYNELRALDRLVWELRWFSVEFGRAEFQT